MNLIDVTLVCEDANSNPFDLVSVAAKECIDDSLDKI